MEFTRRSGAKNMTKILVVDTSSVTRAMLKMTLEQLKDVQVDTAAQVDEAQALCRRRPYHLLILEYLVDNHTAIELLESLEKEHLQTDIPIFILSSEKDLTYKKQAREHHVSAWIKKPFQPKSLLNLVQTTLHPISDEASPDEVPTP